MSHYRLCLIGFGNVGQAFARLLMRKHGWLEREYGISVAVTGIRTGRHGAAIDPQGLDLEKALRLMGAGSSLDALSVQPAPMDGLAFIRACPADVLFENSPVNHETGQPAIDALRTALEEGMHAITANKGPVVHGYRFLEETAAGHGRKFRFESTVMDGAPIFSLFRETLPLVELKGFRGILNSCTNLILTRMEQGETFDQALAYAQSIGMAETDPSADVDGWDAAIKVAALITVLMDIPFTPQMVERRGMRSITPTMLAQAHAQGKRWKLVCSARRSDGTVTGQVQPEMV
ncbi:MAG: homoserine dehydrogenase, partial [Anaerolineaceae bacterium]|nr:homoserine dehydrogenase [Anaerolineaceae bacterium]